MKVFQDPTSLNVGQAKGRSRQSPARRNRSSDRIDSVDESRRARRERERWQKLMLRRLEELDRLDREHGLGTYPGAAGAAGPRHRRPGPALLPEVPVQRRRRAIGPVIPGLLIAAVIAAAVMLRAPGVTGYRFQQLVDELTGRDGSYEFVRVSTTGRPVGWDPCEPIHYVVNPAGAPSDWEDTVEEAVETISDASRFDFVYDGTTTDRDFESRFSPVEAKTSPVLIGWAEPGEVSQLKGSTAGVGGGTAVRDGGRTRFVTGIVVLDRDAFAEMDRTGRGEAERLIIAHELGHVLGLDHVDDSGELMHAEYVGQRGFGDGDRKGFARLRDLPCG